MARNSEKAVTALARWRQLQLKEQGRLKDERRPHSVQDEFNPRKAEKWRNQVIREIAKKVTQIQNAGLGEFKIRDLNDEINQLLREKLRWEERIVELGGPDYQKIGPKILDREGKEAPGNRGYKYFGAAKDLPGVKELFEQEAEAATRKTRRELLKEIDPEYYGYLDEDEYLLLEQEEKCEKEARRKLIEEYRAKNQMETDGQTEPAQIEIDLKLNHDSESEDEEKHSGYFEKNVTKSKHLHIGVPSMREVEEALLEKKKRELLSKYVSDELMQSEQEAKTLAGKN